MWVWLRCAAAAPAVNKKNKEILSKSMSGESKHRRKKLSFLSSHFTNYGKIFALRYPSKFTFFSADTLVRLLEISSALTREWNEKLFNTQHFIFTKMEKWFINQNIINTKSQKWLNFLALHSLSLGPTHWCWWWWCWWGLEISREKFFWPPRGYAMPQSTFNKWTNEQQ